MGEGMITREDIVRMTVMENESSRIYVGKVKDKNDYSYHFESGVWTCTNYKIPFHYNGTDYFGMSVVTFVIDESTAQTNVWGRPVGKNCLGERKLEELCKTHKLSEMPKVHEETVKSIRQIYWDMHAQRIDEEIKKAENKEAQAVSTGNFPF